MEPEVGVDLGRSERFGKCTVGAAGLTGVPAMSAISVSDSDDH